MAACPCCSGQDYAACCQPFHQGAEPPSPAQLMRSRYSAFALKKTEHLARTLHSSHPDARQPKDVLLRDLKRTCNRLSYPGLEVLAETPGHTPEEAFVTFWARVFQGGVDVGFVEKSRFLKEAGGWKYVDGTMRSRPGLTSVDAQTLAASLAR